MGKNCEGVGIIMIDASVSALKDTYGDRVKCDEPLARYTTFKIGGPADIFFEAKTADELIECIRIAREHQLPVFILGGGTNILIGDRGIRGLVVKNGADKLSIRGVKGVSKDGVSMRKAYVESETGVVLNRLVRFTLDEGLAGFEMHLGLPGTVGGAIFMNSKWMHPEGYVGDRVYRADVLKPDGSVISVDRSYFQFGYDYSTLQDSADIVVRVIFELDVDDKVRLWDIANKSIAYRRSSQPQGIKSAGCTFQNISIEQSAASHIPGGMTSAGYLIDKAGLKGRSEGGAVISPVHANFIANTGGASARDVLQLISLIRSTVRKQFGVELSEEIRRVGEF